MCNMCETHEALKVNMRNMESKIDNMNNNVNALTKTVMDFIIDNKETNITRKEAEEKFTQKTSFRVGVAVM